MSAYRIELLESARRGIRTRATVALIKELRDNKIKELEAERDRLIATLEAERDRLIATLPTFEEWLCEREPEKECCGRNCDETEGLKLGMGWNRWCFGIADMITEQLFCEICFEENTTHKCRACSEKLPYSEMDFRQGGDFGEDLYSHNQFFCKGCIIDINRRSRVDF